jgi:hypothetical protein
MVRAGSLASAFILILAGCGGSHSAATRGTGQAPAASAPAGTAPTAPTGTAPTGTAPAGTTPSAEPTAFSASELTARLLTVADLPSGFTVDADPHDTEGRISSTDTRCGPLVDLMNSDGKPPGAVADADASFTKSELGPNIATGLASFPSVAAAQSFLDTVSAAMKSCGSLTETDKDGSSYDFGVAPLAFPPTGDAASAIRMSADLGGYPAQVDIVLARVGSTLLYVANTGLGGTDTGLTEEVAARAVAKVR